jgi:hypothetical protein
MNQPPETGATETPGLSLPEMAQDANTRLENTIGDATQQAFNLGCLIGMMPAVIFSVVIFLATGFSLIGASMAVVLGVVSAIAFANLAAMITRQNTMKRAYRETINPGINNTLQAAGIARSDFDRVARETLPPSAPLVVFLPIPETQAAETPLGDV